MSFIVDQSRLALMTHIKSVCNDTSCRDVAIVNSKSFNLLHILSIRNEDGRELTSTKTTAHGHTVHGQ